MALTAAALLDRFQEADIVRVERDGDDVHLTESYLAAVEQTERQPAADITAALADIRADVDHERLAAIADDDPEFAARYLVLAERLSDLTPSEMLRAAMVLDQLEDPPRSDGVPDSCLAVRGERLQTFLQFGQPTLIYVWREDCEPCDVVRDELDDLSPDEDIARFAVYGPANAALLYEEYDVSGAPTLLFARQGRVTSRLLGSQHGVAIEAELSRLADESDLSAET